MAALALSLWLVTLLAISIRGLVTPQAHSVYPIYAEAAWHWQAGADLYGAIGEPFRYSPLVAALLVPFSVLPDPIGGVLWRLLNASVYLGALLWWCRAALPRPLTGAQQAWLFLLVMPLSIGSLNNGQSNALVLGLLLASVAGATSGRWNLAAGCMAVACLFKVYPVAVGLLLAAVYGRRFAGRFVVALGVGLALPFFLQEPNYVLAQYAGWFQHLRTNDRQSLPLELWYRDFRLLCYTFHLPLGPSSYAVVQLVAGAGFAGICVLGRWAGRGPRPLLVTVLALGCCWMTLFGPATESCTYILLAPSLAWALLDAWSRPNGQALRAGLLASFVLFTVTGAAVWFSRVRSFHALGPHALAALVFLVCQLAMEFRECISRSPDKDMDFPVAHAA